VIREQMTAQDLADALTAIAGADRVRRDVPMAKLTTFRVGGPAEFLVDVSTANELRDVIAACTAAAAPVTILGGGSNLLVADPGVPGVIIRTRLMDLSQPAPDVVRAGAGLTINGLVRWTIGRGLASLEAWAGTPGTVGGAIYGNAHFSGRNISEFVTAVRVMNRAGHTTDLVSTEMEFAYDTSRLQRTKEVLISADFAVEEGDPAALREIARASLAHRKRTQPLDIPSAGCIFQNPDRDAVPADVPASAGALIDRAGLKGHRVGGAMISPVHCNFIVNAGDATAADVAALIELARDAVRRTFHIELRDEVVRVGF
jgi:UDP-N-acetylmuramate dehydrogenase